MESVSRICFTTGNKVKRHEAFCKFCNPKRLYITLHTVKCHLLSKLLQCFLCAKMRNLRGLELIHCSQWQLFKGIRSLRHVWQTVQCRTETASYKELNTKVSKITPFRWLLWRFQCNMDYILQDVFAVHLKGTGSIGPIAIDSYPVTHMNYSIKEDLKTISLQSDFPTSPHLPN